VSKIPSAVAPDEEKKGFPWKNEAVEGANLIMSLMGWNIPGLIAATEPIDQVKITKLEYPDYVPVGAAYTVRYDLEFTFDDTMWSGEDYGIFYYKVWLDEPTKIVYEDWQQRGRYKPTDPPPQLFHDEVENKPESFIIDEDKSWKPSGSIWVAAPKWNCENKPNTIGVEAYVYRYHPKMIIDGWAPGPANLPGSMIPKKSEIPARWEVAKEDKKTGIIVVTSPFWIDNIVSDGYPNSGFVEHHGPNLKHEYRSIIHYGKFQYSGHGTIKYPSQAKLLINDLDPLIASLPPDDFLWGWKRIEPEGMSQEKVIDITASPNAIFQNFKYEGRHGKPSSHHHDAPASWYENEWGLKAEGENSILILKYNAGKFMGSEDHKFNWNTIFTKGEPFSIDCLPKPYSVREYDSG